MSEITTKPPEDAENSPKFKDANGKTRTTFTSKEAEELGLRHEPDNPPPEPKTCKYCGKTLYHEGIYFCGKIRWWNNAPERCTCAAAKAYWERADARKEREKAEKAEEEARKKRLDKINRLLGNSGIKKRFANRTFENFIRDTPEREKCYSTVKRYADNFHAYSKNGDGLYIEGGNGTGKTHLAAAIALQLISNGIPCICKTSIDLFADIRKAFDENADVSEHQVTEVYKTVDLLIIDDLGKEQCTEWSMSALYSILNDRYEDMKPTVITTNYGMEDLITALTPRGGDKTKIAACISRLRETCTLVVMNWEDFRLR